MSQAKKVQILEKEAAHAKQNEDDLHTWVDIERENHRKKLKESTEGGSKFQGEIRRLKKRVYEGQQYKTIWWRRRRQLQFCSSYYMAAPTYSPKVQSTEVVLSGCACSKVRPLIKVIGNLIGAKMKQTMRARTVGRTTIQGYVAAKVQMGYKTSRAKGIYFS